MSLKIAIFDLTDCEGCELQFIALREKLADLGHHLTIDNWRLATSGGTAGPYDVTFIEGSPISDADIELVKQARKVSKKIVTLGTCAVLGGVQAALPEAARKGALKSIYGDNYQSASKAPKSVGHYVEVDIHLPGCPVNPDELERLLECLTLGKKYNPRTESVCADCKARGNACLFLDEGFCLGPVTRGGCGAPCPAGGLRCYGCFGPLPDANFEALTLATEHMNESERERALRLFFKNSDQYRDYLSRPKKGRK